MKTNFEHFSKQVVRILLSITLPCTAAAETQDAAPPETYTLGLDNSTTGTIHITVDDIIGVTSDNGGTTFTFTQEEVIASQTEDCIITGKVITASSHLKDILSDDKSYMGMLRENHDSQNGGFSGVGGLKDNGTDYEFVFNRAVPNSTIGSNAVLDSEQTRYKVLRNTMPNGIIPTLQYIYDAITVDKSTVAIAVLRTPSNSDDMYAISILDTQGKFMDFVVGCPIAESSDTDGLTSVAISKQRLEPSTIFLGTVYGVDDIIEANHYSLTGVITPEPTTTTLGLAALAGLCTRRRRK